MYVSDKNKENAFYIGKKTALDKLSKAMDNDLVDLEIMPVLDAVNKNNSLYTTSSCYGRIVVSDTPLSDSKKRFRFISKWHTRISLDDLRQAISERFSDYLVIKSEPVILHIVAKDIDASARLLSCAKKAGLKRSGIFQIRGRIIIEIMGVDAFSSLLGKEGDVLVSDIYLRHVLMLVNRKFEKNRKKTKCFLGYLREL